MAPNLSTEQAAVQSHTAPAGSGSTPIELPPIPHWWLGERKAFEALVEIRSRIHGHEKAAAKKAQSVLAATLLAAVSIYSMDATGAAGAPTGPSFLALFVAIAVPAMLVWLLDRRLLQQLSDIDLRSKLWLELVDAVKHDRVDVAQLAVEPAHENGIERLLRKEADIAARFLASRQTLSPRLPIFGHCFTLGNS